MDSASFQILFNTFIYAAGGSVHTCALCEPGRHNAADTIGGKMWAENIKGKGKLLYTTGRITSEIVIKTAFMDIPVLLSRSGVTKMGLELANDLGMVIIGRAKGNRFLVYSGTEYVDFAQ